MSSGDLALYQQLNSHLTALVDDFTNLVRAGGAGALDETAGDGAGGGGNARGSGAGAGGRGRQVPGELLEALTEKLLAAGHQCIHVVSQLKRGAMLSDFAALITNVRATRSALEHQTHQAQAELAAMRQDVQLLLHELESHYYSSAHRGPPPPPPRGELAVLCASALQGDTDWGWLGQAAAAAAAAGQPPPQQQQQQ